MSRKMKPVVHFEMPFKNNTRMQKFYQSAFGWETKELGAQMGEYVLATTTEPGENGFPKNPGAINGGFYPQKEHLPNQAPSLVIAVDDIHESMKMVKDNGGMLLGEPVEIPGYGMYMSFFDTEGNRVSMMQSKMPVK